jgi:hypothetical protein
MLQNKVRWDIGETDPVQRSADCGSDVAQGKLTFHPHVETHGPPVGIQRMERKFKVDVDQLTITPADPKEGWRLTYVRL